jgi:uncharacterized protein (TIGR03435 family)
MIPLAGRSQCLKLTVVFPLALLGSAMQHLCAQNLTGPDTTLAFDTAAIHQNLADESTQGVDRPRSNFPIGSDDAFYETHGVFSATNLPLISYIIFAYAITNNNRQELINSVPSWVNTDRYNIEARTDRRRVTKDEMRMMMRTLLQERLSLRAHSESREVSVYAASLVVPGTFGPQLRERPKDAPCVSDGAFPGPVPSDLDAAGFPRVCGSFVNSIRTTVPHHRRLGGGNLPMSRIVGSFKGLGDLTRPVVDKTGLTGHYDYTLEYLPDPPPGREPDTDAVGPTFVGALKSELGIKLASDKATIDFILVDHIERPSAN